MRVVQYRGWNQSLSKKDHLALRMGKNNHSYAAMLGSSVAATWFLLYPSIVNKFISGKIIRGQYCNIVTELNVCYQLYIKALSTKKEYLKRYY